MALSSLYAHKLRSILTMLGIIIGVGSVIAIVAIGQGGEEMLKSQFSGEQNTIELHYEPSDEELDEDPNAFFEAAITEDDIRAIEDIPEIKHVMQSSTESSTVRHYEEETDGTIIGISKEYIHLKDLQISEGNHLTSSDFLTGSRSAIVSPSFQNDLFKGDDMIGKVIYIDSQPVEIIGVLEKEDDIFAFDSNDIYLPLKHGKIFLLNQQLMKYRFK